MRNRGFTMIEILIVIAIVSVLAAILVPNFMRARARGQITACKSNLKNVATALEMYSTDNGGRFPLVADFPDALTPNYLRAMPTCPGAGSDTYSPGYSSQHDPALDPTDSYLIYCNGNHHRGAGLQTPNYPQYDSATGLVERP